MFGLSAEVGVALLASVAGRVEGAATAAVALALGQRKKLRVPSSMSFSSGSKPVCFQNSSHVNGELRAAAERRRQRDVLSKLNWE